MLIEFFENKPIFNSPREETGGWTATRFEIFRIVFHELFIYTIAIFLKNKNYELAADLLYSKYYQKDKYRSKSEPESFVFLYDYHTNLENYSFQVFNKITGFGDYIITNLSDSLKKEEIILADTLCYFVSYIDKNTIYDTWFPNTYLYGGRLGLNFFERITSEKQFEKIKVLFNIKTKQELQEKLNTSKANSKDRIRYGRGSFNHIPFIHELVNPDTIAIYR